ncbi:testis-expressed protein 33 isoform X2 [Hippoglossus hippoglossus]|uniref:testis-expressed protein 33 isoform X2 n=1 Tax=Hippoglossus hippoglossus TaxID=8267 RepID=UPI00148C847A|nr:testis-expressed protein 33 isoform X2 [Hippoglossus hippoglossus]
MTSVGQKHKQVVKAQVRAVESAVVPPLSLPHYADPGSASSRLHSYHSLGRCLRSNVFPGALVKWKSLSQDSYISHPVTAWPADPHLWYGHRTDEMDVFFTVRCGGSSAVQWTERNITSQKLSKILTEMEKRGTAK